MERTYEQVIKCYDRKGLEETLLNAIQKELGDGTEISPDNLAPVDEFHIRGRESTTELTELLGELTGREVLDVGCGLGGTARYLSSSFDCPVTGIDLMPTYISLAKKLSNMVGLEEKTSFYEASALELPFSDGHFDVVWMEHVQMNISSKDQLIDEIKRVLRPEGVFVFHEIFSISEAEPYLPVPWADVSSGSFLISQEDFRSNLEKAGLEIIQWKDVSQSSVQWFNSVTKQLAESGPSPLGLHLLMGEAAPTKLENVGKNLQENRICVVQSLCRKR
ncbi:class I SAM-dependent methyltransferase [Fodinibius sediminis]|uniref:Ubiquinone/menaquinone biosynthesis C-methylase UbiE n=1 Tax=Fodinibius sediminis TaxID=1214077 RepID=A0A521E667_9BACT|nr:methyltransferase domain-containing protein [Fodinibius sediminis]SMO79389.1 Ubiquinone/menaquinone biosynthesis C-methylase UbiE [Fodinibius sediminis]